MTTPADSARDSSHPFGALLRRYRTLAGLSQESLAGRAGVSVRAVSDLERGVNRAPRVETLELLVAALGLGPADRAALIAAAHPDLDSSPPPAAAQSPAATPRLLISTRLPWPPTPLIGREADLARGLRLFEQPETRLLTITGPGGSARRIWRWNWPTRRRRDSRAVSPSLTSPRCATRSWFQRRSLWRWDCASRPLARCWMRSKLRSATSGRCCCWITWNRWRSALRCWPNCWRHPGRHAAGHQPHAITATRRTTSGARTAGAARRCRALHEPRRRHPRRSGACLG